MKLQSIINSSRLNVLLRMSSINTLQLVEDHAKEGQIKTYKMEQALVVYPAADHVDRVKKTTRQQNVCCVTKSTTHF
jgi:hypothetical protein